MIEFKEFPVKGYAARTVHNCKVDLVIAIAKDFTTAGEILTRNSSATYLPIDYNNKEFSLERVSKIRNYIHQLNPSTIHIAGNGIYTIKEPQNEIDEWVYTLLWQTLNKPVQIKNGGQTGIDEAAAKACHRMGLNVVINAPNGWAFRGISGKDIYNEKLFKDRFI